MYLHLGGDISIPTEEILAVCDLDNASCSFRTRAFLERAEKEGRVINAAEDLPKSFVLCEDGGTALVYLSQLNSATLLRRAECESFE